MSKLFYSILGLLVLILIGGFAFFAFSTPDIEQKEIIIELPADRF